MTVPVVAALICAGALLSAQAAENKPAVDVSKLPAPAKTTGVTYESQIKPILDQSCVKCHGPERAKQNLRLDSLEGALKGARDGKVIVPGKSAESPLVHSIAYLGDDQDHYMPPPDNRAGIKRLTDEQVGLIRAWIDQGAK